MLTPISQSSLGILPTNTRSSSESDDGQLSDLEASDRSVTPGSPTPTPAPIPVPAEKVLTNRVLGYFAPSYSATKLNHIVPICDEECMEVAAKYDWYN
ncbi:unnamed protein product [Caenorhabditis bovis]|nr:unnamed protein product [Caenorhabditis bovis]